MSRTIDFEQGERYSLAYRCRDIGYGIEKGNTVAVYQGVETFGKLIFEPVDKSETIYLFPDEITDAEPSEAPADVWAMLEEAPVYARDVADLYHWSTNYDAGKGPFTLFLDLIGWSKDEIGEPLYSLKDASLGYLELAKLSAALTEYTNRPQDVRAWVDTIVSAEVES